MEIKYNNEQWKDIKGYENYYQISNYGRVKSLNRLVKNKNGYRNTGEKILKPLKPIDNIHYPSVNLCKNGKIKNCMVHRLVAEAFIYNDDPINKKFVNHKDENKLNNMVDNLEWCTALYNNIYNNKHNRAAKNTYYNKRWKAIYCEELQKEFRSIRSASIETGDSEHTIKRMCDGLNTTSLKYHWRYL